MANTGGLFWTGLWLLLAAIAAFIGVGVARTLRSRYGRDQAGTDFTLEDLRRMRDDGRITESEHAAMRAAILGSFADRPPGGDKSSGGNAAAPRSPPPPAE